MDEFQILNFKRLFDLVKQDPLEVTLPSKIQLLEFTLNIPHKKLAKLTAEQQKSKYADILEKSLKGIDYSDLVHYYETCKDGKYHLHGKVNLLGKFYIEGVVNTFSKQAVKNIDGRMQFDKYGYYPNFYRYRSPCVCAQYTDELERELHWQQYISKNN